MLSKAKSLARLQESSFKSRRDSNPQPSDRQAVAQNSQVIENTEVTGNAKLGLPAGLPAEYLSDPELAMIVEKWPEIPLFVKRVILKMIS